jgi:hypothetical protein
MRSEQRIFAWKVQDRRRTTYERIYQKRIYQTLTSQVDEVLMKFAEEGLSALDNFDADKLYQVIKQLYIDTGGAFAGAVYREVQKADPPDNMWRQFMEAFFQTTAADRVVNINDNTRRILRAKLAQGLEEELPLREVARNIRREWAQTSLARSLTIARTETLGAANRGALQGADAVSIPLKKVWLATFDGQTRDAHIEMFNSDPIPLYDDFIVGGEAMSGPGDAGASAENVINCRCAISFVPAE